MDSWKATLYKRLNGVRMFDRPVPLLLVSWPWLSIASISWRSRCSRSCPREVSMISIRCAMNRCLPG